MLLKMVQIKTLAQGLWKRPKNKTTSSTDQLGQIAEKRVMEIYPACDLYNVCDVFVL